MLLGITSEYWIQACEIYGNTGQYFSLVAWNFCPPWNARWNQRQHQDFQNNLV